jgi:hypothetical protein
MVCLRKELGEASNQRRLIGDLAFPNHQDAPPALSKRVHRTIVSPNVILEFSLPEVGTRLGHVGELTSLVAMPIAAMDKDNSVIARQYDVRLSWQIPAVKTEAIAKSVEQRPYGEFGRGILSPYP